MTACAIIIPTYNRPDYLARILAYYNDCGKDFNIIVADSSSNDIKKINKKLISQIRNLDILYVDKYSAEISFYFKFADIVNYVKEKYCVFCADDDFSITDGIKKSVDFLEKNNGFAAAHGKYVKFNLKINKEKKQEISFMPIYPHKSITSDDAKTRLIVHLSNYYPTFYAVHRSHLLKEAYKEALKSKINPLLFGELLPSAITLIYGKIKSLNVLYAARDGNSVGTVKWPGLFDFIEKGEYSKEYPKFREGLANCLSKKSQLTVEESRKAVDYAMSNYLKRYYRIHRSKIHKIKEYLNHLISNNRTSKDEDYEHIEKIKNHILLHS